MLRLGYGMTTFALPWLNCEMATDIEPPLAARIPREAPFENSVRLTAQLFKNATCPAVIGAGVPRPPPPPLLLLLSPPQPAATTSAIAALATARRRCIVRRYPMPVFFGLERPRLFPKTFGFHEHWHVMTVLAAVCHYLLVLELVRA